MIIYSSLIIGSSTLTMCDLLNQICLVIAIDFGSIITPQPRPEYVPTWQLLTRSHYAREPPQTPKYTARRLCVAARDALHRERDSTCMRRIISRRIYAELE